MAASFEASNRTIRLTFVGSAPCLSDAKHRRCLVTHQRRTLKDLQLCARISRGGRHGTTTMVRSAEYETSRAKGEEARTPDRSSRHCGPLRRQAKSTMQVFLGAYFELGLKINAHTWRTTRSRKYGPDDYSLRAYLHLYPHSAHYPITLSPSCLVSRGRASNLSLPAVLSDPTANARTLHGHERPVTIASPHP